MALDAPAISRRIARARKAAGMNQHQLAAALGVHWRSIQNWERPDQSVPWDRLTEIADRTDVSVEWLLGFEAVPAKASPAALSEVRDEIASLRELLRLEMDAHRRGVAEAVLERIEDALVTLHRGEASGTKRGTEEV